MALALAVVVPLTSVACVSQAAQSVRGFELAEIRDSLAELPGVDTEARAADGTPLLAVDTLSDQEPAGIALSVPVHDTLSIKQVQGLFTSVIAAVDHEELSDELTLVRRGGTPSESTMGALLFPTERAYETVRHWWELSAQAGVSVMVRPKAEEAALLVDATDLPDHASEAVPSIDRLGSLLASPPPEHVLPEFEVWTVRDLGPEISLTARATHLVDQEIWDGLTAPALDGLVESIKFNDRSEFYRGRLMAGEDSADDRTMPDISEDTPPVATLSLADRSSPLLEPGAVRALHAVPGLRYLRLPLDADRELAIGYTIDLEMCSAEVSEARLRPGSEPEEAQPQATPATLTRSGSHTSTTTTPTTLRGAPSGVSDEANEAAWALWRLLGCD